MKKINFDYYTDIADWRALLDVTARHGDAVRRMLLPRVQRDISLASGMPSCCPACKKWSKPYRFNSESSVAKYKCASCNEKYTYTWSVAWMDNEPRCTPIPT